MELLTGSLGFIDSTDVPRLAGWSMMNGWIYLAGS